MHHSSSRYQRIYVQLKSQRPRDHFCEMRRTLTPARPPISVHDLAGLPRKGFLRLLGDLGAKLTRPVRSGWIPEDDTHRRWSRKIQTVHAKTRTRRPLLVLDQKNFLASASTETDLKMIYGEAHWNGSSAKYCRVCRPSGPLCLPTVGWYGRYSGIPG